MCDVVEEEVEKRVESTSLGRACMKCRRANAARIVCRLRDPLCPECFEEYVAHKFRSALAKSKAIAHGSKVLVAISGGPSSSAMLHLLQTELKSSSRKRTLDIEYGILIIEDLNDMMKKVVEATTLRDEKKCPIHVVSMANAFPTPEAMTSLFESMTSLSAKEAMLENLRYRLYEETARKYGYRAVLLGHSSTRAAVNLISGIAQGRGSLAALGICSRLPGDDVAFVRPMIEVSAKEIGYFNYINRVTTIAVPSLDFACQFKASIGRLTEAFLTALQADFPSTVNAVYRTGNKLLKETDDKVIATCILCGAPIQSDSEKVCGGSSCTCQKKTTVSTVLAHLCYACKLIVKDVKETEIVLPIFAREEMEKRQRRISMRAQIEDFLL
ncbi:cytoplasmic tRNA 2-thiolation protein 2-B-like [Oscarella lobularis]|uniref:cytoplasmic tRNA 2-thiolation protein 2-B-like n=1 Tax=Oscarella lobularis TaxID=121494 RepID=UPI0033144740